MMSYVSRCLDPQFLFRMSWILTLALFAAIACFTLFLVALKRFRALWKNYKAERIVVFNRKVYEFVDEEFSGAARKWLGNLSLLDRGILKNSILKLSENFAGDWGAKLCVLFEELGFADDEIKRTNSLHPQVRKSAASRLGMMKCVRAVPALNSLLADRSAEVRLAAAKALGDIGALESLESIVESLARLSKIAAIELAILVSKAGQASVPSLIKLCAHPDIEVRIFAVELLGTVSDPRSRDTLLYIYRTGNLEVRMACLKAFRTQSLVEDVEIFLARMVNPTLPWEEKAGIAKIMGQTQCLRSVPYLKECLFHSSWWVRRNAGEALSRMGDLGEEALVDAMDSSDPYARGMAVQWLEDVGFIEKAILFGDKPGTVYFRFLEQCSRLGLRELIEENKRCLV